MIKVGISEYKTGTNPNILSCVGLGSCVGICLYDPVTQIGGLAHILLPDSRHAKEGGKKPGKFADTAVEALLSKMELKGSSKRNIRAKLVGGAAMFSSDDTTPNGIFCMGPKNVVAVKNALDSKGIKIDAEDTGGKYGRTIKFYVGTGKVTIKTMTGTIEI